jgi:hypothetical protein
MDNIFAGMNTGRTIHKILIIRINTTLSEGDQKALRLLGSTLYKISLEIAASGCTLGKPK